MVTNWGKTKIGSKQILSYVAIREFVFENGEDVEQYRILKMTDGYTVEVWRKKDGGDWEIYQAPTYIKQGNGANYDEIPFIFVGSMNNNSDVDDAPLMDIADINLGHYQNSADYEQLVFSCGQVQPYITGINEQWYEVIKKEGIILGAGSLLPLPTGAEFKIAQAQPNTLAREAMKDKELMMRSLGAALLQENISVKTATQVNSEDKTQYSVLSLIAKNTSEAYTKCLNWMLKFLNVSGEVLYSINTEYTKQVADAQMITALNALYQGGKFSEVDLWANLRKFGLVDPEKTDEDIKAELDNDMGGLSE